jgi:helicase
LESQSVDFDKVRNTPRTFVHVVLNDSVSLDINELPVSAAVREHYYDAGITQLYPPQEAAVKAGVVDGENVIVAIPTAAGKTLIAQLAMLTADGPALYIVPLRALAREKYETFTALPGIDAAISTGDFDAAENDLETADVVVATAEKVDSAIRNGASWVDKLACVVVDEVHLLGSANRGPTLEITLATIQRRASGVQVVALSATIDNPEEVASWLDAELVSSTWRPVSLRTGVYDASDETVIFDDGNRLPITADSDSPPETATDLTESDDTSTDADTKATISLVADAVISGGQCLAFVRSRQEAASLAKQLADVGESAFRNRDLRVICATPTLAAGVNVPARRVVVRDLKRYTGEKMAWLPVLEVHQMCGRAGRPHLDPYGEAVLIGDITNKIDSSDAQTSADGEQKSIRTESRWRRYVDAGPESIESQLTARNALRTHVLALIVAGFADSKNQVLDVLDSTFFAHQSSTADLTAVIDDVVAELIEMGLLTTETTNTALAATAVGKTVSQQYIQPTTGAELVDGIQSITSIPTEQISVLTALEVVCGTPDMHDTYLGNRERADLYRFATSNMDTFVTNLSEIDDFESWLCTIKLAQILTAWSNGVTIDEIVERYRVGPGDIESHVERARWLLGTADALTETLGVEVDIFAEGHTQL